MLYSSVFAGYHMSAAVISRRVENLLLCLLQKLRQSRRFRMLYHLAYESKFRYRVGNLNMNCSRTNPGRARGHASRGQKHQAEERLFARWKLNSWELKENSTVHITAQSSSDKLLF